MFLNKTTKHANGHPAHGKTRAGGLVPELLQAVVDNVPGGIEFPYLFHTAGELFFCGIYLYLVHHKGGVDGLQGIFLQRNRRRQSVLQGAYKGVFEQTFAQQQARNQGNKQHARHNEGRQDIASQQLAQPHNKGKGECQQKHTAQDKNKEQGGYGGKPHGKAFYTVEFEGVHLCVYILLPVFYKVIQRFCEIAHGTILRFSFCKYNEKDVILYTKTKLTISSLMDPVKVIEIKKSIFANNDEDAALLRKELKAQGVFLLNLMSSPGSGKTTTLIQTIGLLKDKLRMAVMEADIDSDVDAIKIKEATGIASIQLHTGGMCHLDAEMTRQGLDNVPMDQLDLVILENVGNLVCPAEFDTGAVANAMILSVPEGTDKPLKYPLMFSICDVVVINKMDVLPYFDFDLEKCKEYIHMRNPKAQVIPICAKTGEGVEAFAGWLLERVKDWKQQ